MKVLIDSSVWIEFFSPVPSISTTVLGSLIQDRRVATCLPIKAEVLSGKMASDTRELVEKAFDAMDFVDPDWNSKDTWNRLTELAQQSRSKRIAIPGTIDRMILSCCQGSGAVLWTLDRKLQRLARAFSHPLFHG